MPSRAEPRVVGRVPGSKGAALAQWSNESSDGVLTLVMGRVEVRKVWRVTRRRVLWVKSPGREQRGVPVYSGAQSESCGHSVRNLRTPLKENTPGGSVYVRDGRVCVRDGFVVVALTGRVQNGCVKKARLS